MISTTIVTLTSRQQLVFTTGTQPLYKPSEVEYIYATIQSQSLTLDILLLLPRYYYITLIAPVEYQLLFVTNHVTAIIIAYSRTKVNILSTDLSLRTSVILLLSRVVDDIDLLMTAVTSFVTVLIIAQCNAKCNTFLDFFD